MKNPNDDSWFILCSKPKQEFIVKNNMNQLGIEVYLPLYLKEKKKEKQKIEVVAPLFSGYVFARFKIEEMYHKVRYTRGVKTVLGNQNYLLTLNNEKIQDIKRRENEGLVTLHKKKNQFTPGDKVLIDEGDFDGWEGIFYEELPDKKRAIILLTSVSYSSKLIIPKKILKPC
jgi:transcriptional antiterminator RfaH